MKTELAAPVEGDEYCRRHIGPMDAEIAAMLAVVGAPSLDALIEETVPADIRRLEPLRLPGPLSEHAAQAKLAGYASENRLAKSFIGLGYYGTHLPAVLKRNVLENPGWTTAYTPYQAEIAQGRLEALLTFQHLISDLTGLPLANASLLDEATAAAEAMAMMHRAVKVKSNVFFVDEQLFPQTLDVLRTRAHFFGFELIVGPAEQAATTERVLCGAIVQTPNARGEIADFSALAAALHAKGALLSIACDPLAQVLLKSPGAMGADIAFGSSQRFGIPMGYGGPHAAFFAFRDEYKRIAPGRLIGSSQDRHGKPALRMALQTREQHIRREKATSNICTSQVLLANLAAFYAVWHGPQGLRAIAERVHRRTAVLAAALHQAGLAVMPRQFFDTLQVTVLPGTWQRAEQAGVNLRWIDETTVGISCDETTTAEDVATLFTLMTGIDAPEDLARMAVDAVIPPDLRRSDVILSHPVFHRYHSEHAMLRYLKRLQDKDLALDRTMIPLGSCTMKLNAAAAMEPISWPQFAHLHPFAPQRQAQGYRRLTEELAGWLGQITGFPALSLQPNSGAQGEYAGLLAIRRYQAAQGQAGRDICLIPKSAHGTNPASAQMAGLTVVVVECDAEGNIDQADLARKASQYAERLSCLMLTYPSTHGVFEAGVREICALIHAHGGQVYMDGANLNAQVGLTSPGLIGADVAHINLHKTFAIPHGGGGPGMGPIGLAAHLVPYAPGHVFSVESQPGGHGVPTHQGHWAVSAAPYGSAAILPISWMYIAMMGGEGLRQASQIAILNANYLAARLGEHYPVLYRGRQGRVAHECILDLRPLKAATGISEADVAKRLMDYGFHAPTVSFPVPGTLMCEPTESENLAELDRFCAALISIRGEIARIERGEWPREDNPLKNAPHTLADLIAENWSHPYDKRTACLPGLGQEENKFWPSVGRIDDVYGDRHLCCTLPFPESTS